MPANYSKQEKELGRTKWYYRGYNRSIIGPYPTEEEAFDSAANHGQTPLGHHRGRAEPRHCGVLERRARKNFKLYNETHRLSPHTWVFYFLLKGEQPMSDLENINNDKDEDINVEGVEGFESEPVRTPTKLDKFKKHLKDNRAVYIALGVGVAIGTVATLVIFKRDAIVITINDSFNITNRATKTNTVVTNLTRQGHPGFKVRCNETGVVFPSIHNAAKSMDMNPSQLSQHLQGKLPHVKGKTFTKLGEMA
jgi:hypothetical protein